MWPSDNQNPVFSSLFRCESCYLIQIFETTNRHKVWMFDWRNMVAIIHPAMLSFAYINDSLIHFKKKVNLHHHPVKLARLDARDYRHKAPSRDNFLVITTLIFFFFWLSHQYVQELRKKAAAKRQICANAPLLVWENICTWQQEEVIWSVIYL